jgi:hypothetical protein
MQVYLPDNIYREVKQRGLPASELLQGAVAAEVRRRELREHAGAYLDELRAEVGEPTELELAQARALADRIERRAPIAQAG